MSEDWEALAQRLALRREQVQAASKLLDDGLPPIFIAHYRKVATGGLDEAAVRRLAAAREALGAIEALRRR
ncbi:MAG: Tex-like N-terminal domain-containing protein, partial [Phycisphaerae bacterium]